MSNAAGTMSLDYLDDGVLRFSGATCLEATLCNTCGIGGGASTSLSTLAGRMDTLEATVSALALRVDSL